jgi:hypothetical protein
MCKAVVDVSQEAPAICEPEKPTRVSKVSRERLVMMFLVVAGVLAVAYHQRASDFLGEDVFYADAARSLMKHGVYGINGRPEANQPPGLSALLAVLFAIGGYSRTICLAAIAVTEALGFLVAYKLLRRHVSIGVAATICMLLISSPICFQMATQTVFPSFPLLLTSMIALWAIEKYEAADEQRRKDLWYLLLFGAVVASLMIAAAEVALLGAMIAASAATYLKDRRLGLLRLRRFLPVVLVGIAVQGLWMSRKAAPLEWPEVPGYPAAYVQQLKVKRGNDPEEGMATWRDIPQRVGDNISGQADLFAQLVLRHGVNRSKVAVTIVPILLTALGWTYTLFQTSGQQWMNWYFAGYECMYLLWPWDLEPRFFLPVVPLACFYAWKGMEATVALVRTRPRLVGWVWFPVGTILGLLGSQWIYTHWSSGLGDLPDELLVPLWFVSAILAARMAYSGRGSSGGGRVQDWLNGFSRKLKTSPAGLVRTSVAALVILLIGIGIYGDIGIARQNVKYPDLARTRDTSLNPMASEIEGAEWIRWHTASTSVVMARHVPTVYHYADRKVVWFPPSSNAEILDRGIARHKVDYILVIKHQVPYYLPDDDYCFSKLLDKYQSGFELVFRDSRLSIFKVRRLSPGMASALHHPINRVHKSA